MTSLVEARALGVFLEHCIDLRMAWSVQPWPPAHRCIVEPVLRPAARRDHPPIGKLMAAALEAARQADIDIRLADWELIRSRLCLPGYVDPEQVVFDADGIFGPSGTRAFQLSGGGCMAI